MSNALKIPLLEKENATGAICVGAYFSSLRPECVEDLNNLLPQGFRASQRPGRAYCIGTEAYPGAHLIHTRGNVNPRSFDFICGNNLIGHMSIHNNDAVYIVLNPDNVNAVVRIELQ